MLSAILNILAAMRRDRRGVAAIEFAIILPVLALFYLGTVEVSRYVQASSKTGQAAETVGNLLTRLKSIDKGGMDNIFAISSAIMNPFEANDLEVVVTAVRVDANGRGTVHWARSRKGSPVPAAGTPVTLPAELSGLKSSYFVSTRSTFTFAPISGFGFGQQTIERVSHFRPRKSLEIVYQ